VQPDAVVKANHVVGNIVCSLGVIGIVLLQNPLHHRVLGDNKVQHKIRLAGIDAPEKKQPFGQRSTQSLSDLVFDKTFF